MEDSCQRAPLFTFGVIADIQYADMDDGLNFPQTRRRYYRNSLELLRQARESWSHSDTRPKFILQMGDIIDGFNKNNGNSSQALERVLDEFRLSPIEVHHVWGNHEFYNFSRSELLRSKLNSSFLADTSLGGTRAGGDIYAYSFTPYPGFTFVVLDAYDVSLLGVEEDSVQYHSALNLIKQHNTHEDLNTPPGLFDDLKQRFSKFNGGFSKAQLDWLDSVLSSADKKQEKVTIMSHLPVHPFSTTPMCLAWNFDELLSIIQSHNSVVCFIAGHDHDGGYCLDKSTGVHHLTLEAVIETSPDSNAFGTVSVYEDRMVLKGVGRISNIDILFP
ncbi:manganese-dependent ADP-ribose/CDP-alcohol diphosphatase [Corythoichthys intestinalis]|uniref:manganese-dependent ADP-ribose/CDP-alcohol diphosphatase n=1 Tax=Corythoichthys intestinalis TaxID=161448 RepID=UPI0025A567F7|nr:manganese-dependent ADP-ribose/CDP-alcohol diphosphatase [Corythoichthys intestinalis]XP_061808078.1 manganese-dependent ADP-ribose/CDP-alcohol diphosphatase [Nerophis lumbriciformis]